MWHLPAFDAVLYLAGLVAVEDDFDQGGGARGNDQIFAYRSLSLHF